MFKFLSPYMLYVYIAIGVVLFGAGWQVNGWRLNAKIEKQKVVLAEKETTIKLLSSAIETSNREIAKLGKATKDAQKRAIAADKKAKAISQASDKKIKAISAVPVRPDANCEAQLQDISKLLESAR